MNFDLHVLVEHRFFGLETFRKEIEDKLMAFKQEILDAIAAERVEVNAKLVALQAKIDELINQIGSGEVVTVADLAEIKTAISDIYTAPPAT